MVQRGVQACVFSLHAEGSMMNIVKIVSKSDLPRLEQLWRDIGREENPGDGAAGERAVQGARRSLSEFDYLDSDSFWIFAAEDDARYVGYAAAARIPKADARVGFMYIDELYVLTGYRNRGHATRILEMAMSHAMDLRLGGIRLLVNPGNATGRRLYEKLGLAERNQILCERYCREP
jgi:ribosomal protein S18 acetylase RimI-like enzyme